MVCSSKRFCGPFKRTWRQKGKKDTELRRLQSQRMTMTKKGSLSTRLSTSSPRHRFYSSLSLPKTHQLHTHQATTSLAISSLLFSTAMPTNRIVRACLRSHRHRLKSLPLNVAGDIAPSSMNAARFSRSHQATQFLAQAAPALGFSATPLTSSFAPLASARHEQELQECVFLGVCAADRIPIATLSLISFAVVSTRIPGMTNERSAAMSTRS